MRRLACVVLLIGCEAPRLAADAALEPDARVLDAGTEDDASTADAPVPIDAAPCCVESHYASFPMPSTVGEGLPHEARFTAIGARVEDEITGRSKGLAYVF